MGTAEDDDIWGFGGVGEEFGKFGVDFGFAVSFLIVFFDGVGEAGAGE